MTFIISDTSVGGDSLGGRLNSDGRHYTVTFPDDFIYIDCSEVSPFFSESCFK